MSASASMPAPGDTVFVSDGAVTVKAVSENSVTYDHHDHSTYTISADNFAEYMGGDA